MECGKCSSRQAAVLSISFLSFPLKGITSRTLGCAFVSVPVLSNTIVSASATASINFPPFTSMLCSLASLIADNTATGIESLRAQEKSTISIETAFWAFLVRRYTSPVPKKLYGTSLSARCSALLSKEDFIFSDSSIICIIFSYLVEPDIFFTFIISSPSSITVPAKTEESSVFLTPADSPVRED